MFELVIKSRSHIIKNNPMFYANASHMMLVCDAFKNAGLYMLKDPEVIANSITSFSLHLHLHDTHLRTGFSIKMLKAIADIKLNSKGLYHLYYISTIIEKTIQNNIQKNISHNFAEDIPPLSSVNVFNKISFPNGFGKELQNHEKLISDMKKLLGHDNLEGIFKKYNVKDKDLNKALRKCVFSQEGTTEEILTLCANGADINAKDTNPEKGFTALYHAINRNRKDMVIFLTKLGARLDAKIKDKTIFSFLEKSNELQSLIFLTREKFYDNLVLKHKFSQKIPPSVIDTLFFAINTIAITSKYDRERLDFLLKNGVKFVITDSHTISSNSLIKPHGLFMPSTNELYIFYKNLDFENFTYICRLLSHETEHTYNGNLHTNIKKAKKLLDPNLPIHNSYTEPYYPCVKNEMLLYGAYLYKGDLRIIDILMKLNTYSQTDTPLNSEDMRLLRSMTTYRPWYTLYKFPKERVPGGLDPSTIKKIQNGTPQKISWFFQKNIRITFWAHKVIFNTDTISVCGYHAENIFNPIEAALALMYEINCAPCNRTSGQFTNSVEQHANLIISEVDAHINELPEEVLENFYPETLEYRTREVDHLNAIVSKNSKEKENVTKAQPQVVPSNHL